MTDAEVFQSYRPLLFSIAYRMLGSASEADDVLQDAYLRYAATQAQGGQGPPTEIRSLKAYLSTIVTRLCLDRLKAAQTMREQYLGPWLPEPVLTVDMDTDPQRDAERHESITLAFLVLLETLTPQERAVFLLREVFEYDYAEIAKVVQTSAANCRQLCHRAKERIAEQRPRFEPAPDRQRQLVERFLAATQRGDVAALANMLAQDVTITADSGGKVPSARKPLHGREMVANLLIGLARNGPRAVHAGWEDIRIGMADVNGEPALLLWVRERLDTLFVFSIVDDQFAAIRAIRNPDKLAYIQRQLQERGATGEPLPTAAA
ncbi:MAG TPA: RNA polymerase sigma-70 factor [Roseiflexaceae bacterium]|nr:RNA polymerase sigma-70 factor [Roseiflexaceae bacterium]